MKTYSAPIQKRPKTVDAYNDIELDADGNNPILVK